MERYIQDKIKKKVHSYRGPQQKAFEKCVDLINLVNKKQKIIEGQKIKREQGNSIDPQFLNEEPNENKLLRDEE